MSRFSHLTPRYVADRLGLMAFERRNPEAPWLTATMIGILGDWLRPTDRGLEWGSGRSTVWLAQRVAHLVSIEDDPAWGERVKQILANRGLGAKVDHRVLSSAHEGAAPTSAPYVAAAARIERESLDFCLVDGSLRDHCALACLHLLKPGGLLVIDNAERYLPQQVKTRSPNARSMADGCETPSWQHVAEVIAGWRSIWTTNGIFDTALWQKPGDARCTDVKA